MNSLTTRITGAVLLLAVGILCWRAGRIEIRMAAADRDLVTLQYETPVATYDEIASAIGYADRLTRAALGRSADAERGAVTARYWREEFATILPEHDPEGKPVVDDPQRLFVNANAAYRAALLAGPDPETVAERLDAVLQAYADVLRADPTYVDAAYNYEFVARLRPSLAAGQEPPRLRLDWLEAAATAGEFGAGVAMTGDDLPAGPTLHGLPGAPPLDESMQQFKVYVPLRPTEREESDEAGKGPQKKRKG